MLFPARAGADEPHLERGFAHPPESARPWVNWFWLDGNITREGITADLEAMQRVGIGGALLMDITQQIPTGAVQFNQSQWHELFKHAVSEARRLGLALSINNAPGWSGSGGPWITPELAMQKLGWSRTTISGPVHFDGALAPIQTLRGFLQPIATLAFPTSPAQQTFRIPLHQAKTGLSRAGSGPNSAISPSNAEQAVLSAVRLQDIIDLTSKTDQHGRLNWDVPPGKWTVLRFGATLMGTENHPAREGGEGLECDKLSRTAIETHFKSFLALLVEQTQLNTSAQGSGFTGIHVDSWEIGFQNWTPKFREEFTRRRGYELLNYLPAYAGQVVESLDVSERFLWDVRRTVADLEADNYGGRLAELAHQSGLQLSIEAYGNGPFDNLLYASRADQPMGEFWLEIDDPSRFHVCKSMASAAHVYGKNIIPAEAFTSYPATARWQNHPGSLKPMADAAFCEGINRLVIHRYAHQPWLDRKPGMTMGRFGVHYERTQTWWEQSGPWHEYLSRCQFLLQQGRFVADLCYLTEEGAYSEPPTRATLGFPSGYEYDLATPEAVMTRMSVKNGRLTLPDGMSYRVLVLPQSRRMTPALLARIEQLVAAGATVLGPIPTNSPSLSQYPGCDAEVQKTAERIWSKAGDGTAPSAGPEVHVVLQDDRVEDLLARMQVPPDFRQLAPGNGLPLRWIHRAFDNTDVYFVANTNSQPVQATCAFRIEGKWPELWNPETGAREKAVQWETRLGETFVPLKLEAHGSCFVVFRDQAGFDPVLKLSRNGRTDPEAQVALGSEGHLELLASKAGTYESLTAGGRRWKAAVSPLPSSVLVSGPWEVRFAPKLGAPEQANFPKLISWAKHSNPGIKYFSGQATYRKRVNLPPELSAAGRRVRLNLGRVEVIAQVRVNGRDLGILWKAPYTVDMTDSIRPGENELEIKVTNLWPNRLIGDEQLPEDCRWGPAEPDQGAPLAAWPEWLLEGKPSPTGRIAFSTWKHWTKDSPLLESGLLGPVSLDVSARVTMTQ